MLEDHLTEDKLQHLLRDRIPSLKKILTQGEISPQEGQERARQLISDLHPSEIAYLIQYLEAPSRETFVTWMKPFFDPEVFLLLDDNVREDIIALLSPHEIAGVLSVLESDDAVSLLTSLEEEEQQKVLAEIPPDFRQSLSQRLRYPEESAGRLMQKEVVALSSTWTIQKALDYISTASNLPTDFQDAFIIDDQNRPIGSVPVSRLIKSSKDLLMKDIMTTPIRSIPAQWNQEDVAFTFRLYDLMSAPVVNGNNELVGMITVDDVMDIVERKAAEDILHMGHIQSSDFYESALKSSISRIHWLVVTLLNTLLTSLVINEFQETLQESVILTVLMPIAAAMGGSTGIQSSTIIIRALATRELSSMNMMRTFTKEVGVALINGSLFGGLLGVIVFLWFSNVQLSFILGGAVVFNMVWAGAAGTFFPVAISRLNYDPALSSGPLLTTTTDVVGYAVFLGFAKLLLV